MHHQLVAIKNVRFYHSLLSELRSSVCLLSVKRETRSFRSLPWTSVAGCRLCCVAGCSIGFVRCRRSISILYSVACLFRGEGATHLRMCEASRDRVYRVFFFSRRLFFLVLFLRCRKRGEQRPGGGGGVQKARGHVFVAKHPDKDRGMGGVV